jgi:diguanylate cyclase (GGDEF)-like protein
MTAQPYILLVEDNPGDARLTQTLMAESGTTGLPPLRWVQTAEAALATLDDVPGCEAVLLDLGLPDSRGLEALHAVTRLNDRVPVIVLTGDDSEPMGLDAVVSGAQDFLVKGSFDAALLRRCISFAKQRKRAEVALLQRSLHDELTQLPRRALLLDRLAAALAQRSRSQDAGALLFVDLDRFKQINDKLGHAAGDAVLCAVAERLRSMVRDSDTVARLGGDEFVVLLPRLSGPGDAAAVGDKLLQALSRPVLFRGQGVQVAASIGIAHFGDRAESAAGLLERADAAMYAAKAAGRGRVNRS